MAGRKGKEAEQRYVARATAQRARISARKARLILDLIKGQQVEPALNILAHNPRQGAKVVARLLRSAIANAREQASADVDKLWVTGGYVDMGKTMKRWLPRAHGRATPLKKKTSAITLMLGER